MKPVEITRAEFEEIRMLHKEENRRIPVSFSTNSDEDVWLSPEPKPVPLNDRVHVKHLSKRLAEVAKVFLSCRTDRERAGGKFFLDWEGAFWKDENSKPHKFVSWRSDEPLLRPFKPMDRSELLAETKSNKNQKLAERRQGR